MPWLGQDFFPQSDSGQFILHIRAKTGTRIEETARLSDLVEDSIRQQIPPAEMDNILDNIGLPYSPLKPMHSTSGVLGANDVDVLVSLRKKHHPTADYVRTLRQGLPRRISRRYLLLFARRHRDSDSQLWPSCTHRRADRRQQCCSSVTDSGEDHDRLAQVAGLTDLHIQQPLDYPTLDVTVDRTKASQAGYTELHVASSVLNSLSGSFQITPMFFVNWNNGVNYNLVAQTPQYRLQSVKDIQNIPIAGGRKGNPEILADVASMKRSHEMAIVSHYNIRRVIDIYGAVQDRDLGAVSGDVAAHRRPLSKVSSARNLHHDTRSG